MNRQETSRILAMITAIYPAFLKDRDPKILADVWHRVFMEDPYELVERALSAFIASDTKGFPPTPGAINAFIVKSRQLREMTDMEAWGLVYKAVTRGYYNSREEFEKLPPMIRKIVGSPSQLWEWAQMSTGEVNTVVASAFMRTYRARQEMEREMRFLSAPPEEMPAGEPETGARNALP